MGLLDFSGFVGDDTTKDEFGVSQADRWQPLFTGLLKAGMLGMAAGENITPGQRAQLMGQIGGAIGDIPKGAQDVEAAGAQMQLRRQQFATNKQKLDQQRKIQAYAQTPEFAAAVKDLPAHVQLGLRTAIEAGDIDTFGRLMQGVDATAARTRGLDIREAKIEADRAKTSQFGSGQNAHTLEILTNGDPDSDVYKAAYADYKIRNTQVTYDKDGQPRLVEPNMSAWRAPGSGKSGPPQPAAPSIDKEISDWSTYGTAGQPPPTPAPTPPPTPEPAKTVSVPDRKPAPPPAETQTAMVGGVQAMSMAEELEQELIRNPKIEIGPNVAAVMNRPGWLGDQARAALNARDPGGIRARQLIAALTANKLREISGATVGEQEVGRLTPNLPTQADDAKTIIEKMKGFKKDYEEILRERYLTAKAAGYIIPEGLEKRYGGKAGSSGAGTGYVTDDGKPVTQEQIDHTLRVNKITLEQLLASGRIKKAGQ